MNIYEFAQSLRDNKSLSGIDKVNQLFDMANRLQLSEADLLNIPGMTPQMIQQGMAATGKTLNSAPQQSQPSYGLAGGEQAIMKGTQYGLNQLDQTSQQVSDIVSRGTDGLQPYTETGGQAQQLMADLSGASGQDAQTQAMQDYQSSPFYDYAMSEGAKTLAANASVTGGLEGGNLSKDLLQHGVGTFLSDYNNQFQNLAQTSGLGLGAATTEAGLAGQEAGLQANLGQTGANYAVQGGNNIGQFRVQAGRDLGNAISGTTTGMSNLINQQGAGLTDIIGTGVNNINNIIQSATNGDAAAKEQLATILANMAAQSGSTYSSQPIIPGQSTNLMGQTAGLISAAGGLLENAQPNTNLQTPAGGYSPVYNGTSGFWQAPSMVAP